MNSTLGRLPFLFMIGIECQIFVKMLIHLHFFQNIFHFSCQSFDRKRLLNIIWAIPRKFNSAVSISIICLKKIFEPSYCCQSFIVCRSCKRRNPVHLLDSCFHGNDNLYMLFSYTPYVRNPFLYKIHSKAQLISGSSSTISDISPLFPICCSFFIVE